MALFGYVLTSLFIDINYQSSALAGSPENCKKCRFEDTSTIPYASQCAAKETITKNETQFLLDIDQALLKNCKIADPCRRVQRSNSSDGEEFKKKEYDFIIVGAGVAGPILANRLSQNQNHTVLLLEAGSEEPVGPSAPYFFTSAVKTTLDWQYETIPQKNACRGNKKQGVCEWPRGKMICGTGCLSGMMYTRGCSKNYDDWESNNNTGWNYHEALRYFKKSERNIQNKIEKKIEDDFHGFDGPMPVANFPHFPKVGDVMLKAAEKAGFRIRDLNGKSQKGFAAAAVMTDNGIRASTSRMYLRPILHRPNLQVLIEVFVTKIQFAGDRAVAVKFTDKFNSSHTVNASKEIILSGGVVGSAQLLMLSGIGPSEDLENLGIPVVKNLSVGHNLHHHVGVEGTAEFENMQEDEFNLQSLMTYTKNQTGPFSSTGLTQVTGFWRSSMARNICPDIQFFLDPYCSREECRKYSTKWGNKTIAGMRSIYLASKCRGTIRLASRNPYDKPIIDPNYLCNESDVIAILEGIRKLQQILKTDPFKGYYKGFGATNESFCKEYPKDEFEYWKCQIQNNTLGENHHAGTCKMGPVSDHTAVVDPELKVHGIQGLRVIDASIMPTPLSANTIAPVIMIAEKGADMIIRSWK